MQVCLKHFRRIGSGKYTHPFGVMTVILADDVLGDYLYFHDVRGLRVEMQSGAMYVYFMRFLALLDFEVR